MWTNSILAVGADLKNQFCVAKGKKLFFGPELGDLREAGNYEKFTKAVRALLKKEKIRPQIIACDLHPGYFSTRFALELSRLDSGAEVRQIQHHHAHLASAIWEHNLRRPVLGVSFDGTGYGTDGQIWGGEFFLLKRNGFERLGHLRYFKMPGGEQVIRQPWRMVLSILGPEAEPFLKDIPGEKRKMILTMLEKGLHSPWTSSAGRIFDAAAALLGICREAAYEAQGPIELEALCEEGIEEVYPFEIIKQPDGLIVDPTPIFIGMMRDQKRKLRKQLMATKFHNAVAEMILKTVTRLIQKTGLKDMVLSGGVFQNRFLMKRLARSFSRRGFRVYMNEKTPVNDLNISRGQLYVSGCTGKN